MKIIIDGKEANVPSGSGGVGQSMAGQSVEPTKGTTVTAGTGAEIFNDYRARTYSSSGGVSTGNFASGNNSHAEGKRTTASGSNSHSEGLGSIASVSYAHSGGRYTVAEASSETSIGAYNVKKSLSPNSLSDIFVVGKGTSNTSRANAFRVSTDGVYGTGAFKSSVADLR